MALNMAVMEFRTPEGPGGPNASAFFPIDSCTIIMKLIKMLWPVMTCTDIEMWPQHKFLHKCITHKRISQLESFLSFSGKRGTLIGCIQNDNL